MEKLTREADLDRACAEVREVLRACLLLGLPGTFTAKFDGERIRKTEHGVVLYGRALCAVTKDLTDGDSTP